LPLYLSILGGSKQSTRGRLALAGIGFTVGLAVVFVVLGMGASVLTRILSAQRSTVLWVAGMTMVAFGVYHVGLFRVPHLERDLRPLFSRIPSPRGFWGAVVFGAAFALGWTPCVGPVLGAALSYAAGHAASPIVAGVELAAYALGLSTPLLVAAFGGSHVLNWTRKLNGTSVAIQRVVGVLLVAMGLLLATDHLALLAPTVSAQAAPTDTAQDDRSAAGCALEGPNSCSLPVAVSNSEPPSSWSTGAPHLVEFMSGHCTVCARMAPLVEDAVRACAVTADTIVQVNVDTAAGRALAARYEVTVVPTFLQIDAQGDELERIIGEQSRAELVLTIADLRGQPCGV
jgi:cytochrome c-type biogenesis protein